MKLRTKMIKGLSSTGEQPYIKVVVKYYNIVFGDGEISERFWRESVPPLLKRQFPRSLDDMNEQDLRSIVRGFITENHKKPTSGICILYVKLTESLGIIFRYHAWNQAKKNTYIYEIDNPFTILDIESLDEVVKRTQIIGHSQGNVLKMLAVAFKHQEQYSKNLFNESLKFFLQSLKAVPRNQRTMRNVGDVFKHLGHRNLARIFYKTAVDSSLNDPISLFKYANFLQTSDTTEAERYFLKSHSIHPSLNNMIAYGHFLSDNGRPEEAQKWFKECTENF